MKDFGPVSRTDLTTVKFWLWHRLPITVMHTINLVWLGMVHLINSATLSQLDSVLTACMIGLYTK